MEFVLGGESLITAAVNTMASSFIAITFKAPSYLHDSFHYAVDITSRAAQNAHRLFVPRVRTTMAKNSFYFSGTQIWNSLNPTLYTARKLANFKLLYKSLLYM